MRIPAAVTVMKSAIVRNRPIVLVSPPGFGKTSVVGKVCAQMGHELSTSTPVLWDITDPKGLPMPCPTNPDKAVFLPFGEVYAMLNATKPTIWFFDDAGQAAEDVQAALMPLFLGRTIAGRKLPECVKLIMATNGVEHQAAVNPMLAPLKTRMAAFINLEINIEDWTEWAMPEGIEPLLIAFLRAHPDYLHKFEDTSEMRAYPCPRVWGGDVNEWLKAQRDESLRLEEPVLNEVIGSLVTDAIAAEFATFRGQYKAMTSADKVLAAPNTAKIPTKVDELYALVHSLAVHVSDATFPNVLRFAARLAENKKGDFAMLLSKLCVTKTPALKQSTAYVTFQSEHQDLSLV